MSQVKLQHPHAHSTAEEDAYYNEKKVQFYRIFKKHKILPSFENIEKIENLPLHGPRELVKDILCFFYKKQDIPKILEKYNGAFPFVEDSTINSYLPDLLILAGLLSPPLSLVNLQLLLKNYGGDPEQLANLRYCTCETILPNIDAPFPERLYSSTSPYREVFIQEIFGNQNSNS